MKQITKFLNLKDFIRKYKGTVPEKETDEVCALIDDVIFDIAEEGRIVTKRIYDVFEKLFNMSRIGACKAADDYGRWLDANNVTEGVAELDYLHFVDITLTEGRKGRAPKLTGKAEKARKGKAEVMSDVNKSDKVKAAKDKLLRIINLEAKKIAKKKGIAPNLINLDKITIKK